MIRIVNSDFNIDDLYSSIKSNKNGAVSIFVGTVRGDLFNENQIIESIFLEPAGYSLSPASLLHT